MSIDTDQLRALPAAEKIRIIEMLWDDLGDAATPIPLPDWIEEEAIRRIKEMDNDPSIGLDHDEVWRRIDRRNG
ncbi:MAG: addiction module protein [Planctomycetaceae bacterium]